MALKNHHKVVYVILLDILYYIAVFLILYLSSNYISIKLRDIQDSILTISELGIVEDIEIQLPTNLTKYISAVNVFEHSKSNIIFVIISVLTLTSLLSSIIKGVGYCIIRNKKFTFTYFKNAFITNLIWRGILFGLFFSALIIIKPEMLLIFWGILFGLFFLFIPMIISNIIDDSLMKSIFYGIKLTLRKLILILLSYIGIAVLLLGILLALSFLPIYYFLVGIFLIIIPLTSMFKFFLFRYLNLTK